MKSEVCNSGTYYKQRPEGLGPQTVAGSPLLARDGRNTSRPPGPRMSIWGHHCAKHFTCISSPNPHNKHIKQVIFFFFKSAPEGVFIDFTERGREREVEKLQ